MLLSNGLPKSGQHALMCWLQWMGLRRAEGHSQYGVRAHGQWAGSRLEHVKKRPGYFLWVCLSTDVDIGDFHMVTVRRDPRNVILSFIRHAERGGEARPHMIDGRAPTVREVLERGYFGQPFVDVYRRFLWDDYIRFEDIPVNWMDFQDTMDTPTRTGSHSDWRTDPRWDQAAFEEFGGMEVLEEAGY